MISLFFFFSWRCVDLSFFPPLFDFPLVYWPFFLLLLFSHVENMGISFLSSHRFCIVFPPPLLPIACFLVCSSTQGSAHLYALVFSLPFSDFHRFFCHLVIVYSQTVSLPAHGDVKEQSATTPHWKERRKKGVVGKSSEDRKGEQEHHFFFFGVVVLQLI